MSDQFSIQTPEHKIISYRELLSVELIQDGHSISKTSRSSQVGNALLGGILLGGVGAVVGALTSASTTKGKVTSLVLEIVVNDTNAPTFAVNFQNVESQEGGFIHKSALSEAREWMGQLNVLIRLADDEDSAETGQSATTLSVADELMKMADLLQRGLLTEDEFSEQKKQLLKNPDNGPLAINSSDNPASLVKRTSRPESKPGLQADVVAASSLKIEAEADEPNLSEWRHPIESKSEYKGVTITKRGRDYYPDDGPQGYSSLGIAKAVIDSRPKLRIEPKLT